MPGFRGFLCREHALWLRGVCGLGAAFWALPASSADFFGGGLRDSLAADFCALVGAIVDCQCLWIMPPMLFG